MNAHRILQNPENKLAWFSILRSPLVGLRLSELQQLSELENFVIELPAVQNTYPALERFTKALDWAKRHLYEFPLREIIEGFGYGWVALMLMTRWRASMLCTGSNWSRNLDAMPTTCPL